MKCHYEILGLPRDASVSEIKKSYRRLALQWHPDKNLDNLQESKEQFQLLQNAYEVLSDPKERAWYDDHREKLIRGNAGSSTENDDGLDVFPFFSPSCYKGFGDDPNGFYSVYSEVFSKLSAEEKPYLDNPEDILKFPKFGKSDTPYEEVHEFYAFWMAFSTNKSFVWLDQYDIFQHEQRRITKVREKANNKIRQKARKERNEEIRRLVSFVRRKDKRVIEHSKILKLRAEENKLKTEQMKRERKLQRIKEIEEAKKKEGECSFNLANQDYDKKLSEIESLLADEFGFSCDDDTISEGGMESSDEESSKTTSEASKATAKSSRKAQPGFSNLYCSACNKIFKTLPSFEQHEKGKKHIDNVRKLTLEFMDINMLEEDDNDASDVSKKGEVNEKSNGHTEDDRETENSTSDIEDNDIRETLSDDSDKIQALPKSQKKKKNKKKAIISMPESEGNDSHDEMSFNEIEGPSRGRRARKYNMLKSQIQAKKEADLKKGSQSQTSTENLYEVSSTTPTDDPLGESALPKDKPTFVKPQRNIKTKKVDRKQMRVKTTETEDSSTSLNLRCAVCHADFPTKNKLFEHLKKTGHSVVLPHASFLQTKKGKRTNR